MTRILIRAVSADDPNVAYLRERIPDAELVLDQQRNAYHTFQLALAAAGSAGAVHMEDDVVLTRDFRAKLEAEIAARPGSVSQFFSLRPTDKVKGSRWDRNFMMAQCFYLPPGESAELLEFSRTWGRIKEHPTGLDVMIADWLISRHERYWLHCPSLVDHRQDVSRIDKRRSRFRQSLTFVEPWL